MTVGMGAMRMAMSGMRVRVRAVRVPAGAMPVGMAMNRMRCLCETAQRHDAEANTSERQTERVGVHCLAARLQQRE